MVVIRISKRELLEARYQRRAYNTMPPPTKKKTKDGEDKQWYMEN